jgi:hypothetical protein
VLKLVTLALLVTGVMQARSAAAAPAATEPRADQEFSEFSLDFTASAQCPPRAEFEAALMSRTPAARLREAESGILAFSVTLAADAAAYSGVLAITLPDGATSQRTVEATSCREASLSLAVIASLVLEAYRQHQTLPAEPAAEESAAPSVAEPSGATAAASPPPAAQEAAAATLTPASPAPAIRQQPTATLIFGLFGALGLETAIAETPPLAGSAGLHLERRGRSLWSPSLRLGALVTANGGSRSSAGSAEFRLIAARLALCPLRLAATSSFSIAPCVELDAGSLRGGAANAPNATARQMPWLALGAGGRAAWALGQVVSLDAFAGVRALARHDHFVLVAPNDPTRSALLYDVPAWSAGFGLGASFRLPI